MYTLFLSWLKITLKMGHFRIFQGDRNPLPDKFRQYNAAEVRKSALEDDL